VKTIKLSWQKRSYIFLITITLILGFILTTLAVREAEREKLVREREQNVERQRYATLLTEEIDTLLSGIEEKIAAALAGPQSQQDVKSQLEACSNVAESEDLIADIFLAGAESELELPLKNPLSFLSERRRLAGENLKKIESFRLFKTAESAELAQQDLPLAIRSYKALLTAVLDNSDKALLLNRIGRCYLKSDDPNSALSTYEELLEAYPQKISSDGVPLGIIAFFQIGSITLETQPEKTGDIILEFYSRLLSPEWPLDRSQFHTYRGLIENLKETWTAEGHNKAGDGDFHDRWEELVKQADAKSKRLESDELLVEKIIPLIQARVFDFNSRPKAFSRFAESAEDNLFLISALSLQRDQVLGVVLDNTELIEKQFPLILDTLPAPEDWLIQIVTPAGHVLAGDEAANPEAADPYSPYVQGFYQGFPPWQVSISHRNPGAIERQFRFRRNLFILAVLAVLGILFFGGFMAIRSTSKELELARLKSEFVSTVSHEFRTPLMSIRYLSEMLDDDRVKGKDKMKAYYGKINKESERLSRLIENMLDFSKIEAGMKKYQFEYLSLSDLVKDVADRFRDYMINRPLTLECEISEDLPNIRADGEALSRALFNLLDNALKYSGKNPVIHIRACLEGEAVFVEVEDKGIGIGKGDKKKVFEKFYRSADPSSRNIEGSGIGLTLVDHIIKAHGGQVILESVLGEGTKVILKLPLSQE